MAKGAAHLGMSQPAVSEAVANLESALEVPLLDRSPRGIEPTVYARALLKRGQVIFDELKQGIRDIEFLTDPTRGEVRIGCPESGSLLIARLPAREGRLACSLRRTQRARCWRRGCRGGGGQPISDVPGGAANYSARPIDKRLHGVPEITWQVPAVRDLNGIRGTVPGGIGAGAVACDDLDTRMLAQPSCESLGLPVGSRSTTAFRSRSTSTVP